MKSKFKRAFVRQTVFVPLCAVIFPVLAQSSLTVDWDWKMSHRCSATSPALFISGIPKETTSLRVSLVDLDVTSFNHGGGSIAHTGENTVTLPEGALKNYRGPCPPNFSSFGHEYEFTVKAIGANGETELAQGSKTKTFSASTVKQ